MAGAYDYSSLRYIILRGRYIAAVYCRRVVRRVSLFLYLRSIPAHCELNRLRAAQKGGLAAMPYQGGLILTRRPWRLA